MRLTVSHTSGRAEPPLRDDTIGELLAWAAEPKLEERKSLGFMTLIYLAVLALLLYLVKKKIWADQH